MCDQHISKVLQTSPMLYIAVVRVIIATFSSVVVQHLCDDLLINAFKQCRSRSNRKLSMERISKELFLILCRTSSIPPAGIDLLDLTDRMDLSNDLRSFRRIKSQKATTSKGNACNLKSVDNHGLRICKNNSYQSPLCTPEVYKQTNRFHHRAGSIGGHHTTRGAPLLIRHPGDSEKWAMDVPVHNHVYTSTHMWMYACVYVCILCMYIHYTHIHLHTRVYL